MIKGLEHLFSGETSLRLSSTYKELIELINKREINFSDR